MSEMKRPPTERLQKLVADGLTSARIAERFGVAPSTVRGWLKTAGIALPQHPKKTLGAWGGGARSVLPKVPGGRLR